MCRQAVWATAIAVLIHSSAACACSCTGREPAPPALMFRGEVLKAEDLPDDASPTRYGNPVTMRTTFNIKEVLKGSPRDGQEVHSVGGTSSCRIDYPRMVGRTVVIAAYEERGKLFTDFCSFMFFNTREQPKRPGR